MAAVAPAPGSLRLVRARHRDESYHATFAPPGAATPTCCPGSRPPGGSGGGGGGEVGRACCSLAGELRDYAALGRGVPAGKDTRMRLRHAAARAVPLAGGAGAFATRIDLIGDRFLRRQVRTLVSTVVAAATPATAPTTYSASSRPATKCGPRTRRPPSASASPRQGWQMSSTSPGRERRRS